MQIESWMTRRVQSVRPLDTIEHAREVLEKLRVNQLPVVVEDRLVGILTDRDLRDAFPSVFSPQKTAHHKSTPSESPDSDPERVVVEMVMTPHVVTLGPNDGMATAAQLMRRERVGAIPIVERDRLVGILTRSDVLDAFVALAAATQQREVAESPTTSDGH